MTYEALSYIITEELGYNYNTIIPLTEVQSIVLGSNESIYPDESTQVMFYHQNSKDLLMVYSGYTDSEGFHHPEKPTHIIPITQIEAIIMASKDFIKSPYKIGMQI